MDPYTNYMTSYDDIHFNSYQDCDPYHTSACDAYTYNYYKDNDPYNNYMASSDSQRAYNSGESFLHNHYEHSMDSYHHTSSDSHYEDNDPYTNYVASYSHMATNSGESYVNGQYENFVSPSLSSQLQTLCEMQRKFNYMQQDLLNSSFSHSVHPPNGSYILDDNILPEHISNDFVNISDIINDPDELISIPIPKYMSESLTIDESFNMITDNDTICDDDMLYNNSPYENYVSPSVNQLSHNLPPLSLDTNEYIDISLDQVLEKGVCDVGTLNILIEMTPNETTYMFSTNYETHKDYNLFLYSHISIYPFLMEDSQNHTFIHMHHYNGKSTKIFNFSIFHVVLFDLMCKYIYFKDGFPLFLLLYDLFFI